MSKQRDFLYKQGAVRTLFFLGELDHIYKIISEEDHEKVIRNIDFLDKDSEQFKYWTISFREQKLKNEVDLFFKE